MPEASTTNLYCLDPSYSTTRLVTRETPIIANTSEVKFETVLALPEGEERIGEGGLRTRGHYKKSLPDKPLISAITVVFNGEKHLEDTILSVLNQTYDNVEYIVIDGGSTDGTVEIIKKYEEQIDYWVSEKDEGIYYAMNKAVSLSLGSWVYVLGSDDKLYEESLYKVSNHLKSQDTVYYGNVTLLSSGEIYSGSFSTFRMMYYNISHQSIFYPKTFYSTNKYDVTYRSAADFELLMRCHGTGKYKIQYISVLVAEYNDMDGISSRQEDPVFLLDRKDIVKKNFAFSYYLIYAMRYYAVSMLKFLRVKKVLKLMMAGFAK